MLKSNQISWFYFEMLPIWIQALEGPIQAL